MHIEAGEENISVTRTNNNHSHRPAQHKAKADKKGKNFRRTNRKLSKEVSSYRPDLKVLHCSELRETSAPCSGTACCTGAQSSLVLVYVCVARLLCDSCKKHVGENM